MSRRFREKRRNQVGSSPHALPSAHTAGKTAVSSTGLCARWQVLLIGFVLLVLVWAVFGQTVRFRFVNYDDGVYVYDNGIVARGLSLDGILWAFTNRHGANWHPLTTLSHMLDCQLYGLHSGGHHLTNVLFHAATVFSLFLVLRNLTGRCWRCALVAAFFAVHPLRSESVAWVAERKDVLSGLFFILTIAAYVYYARRSFALGRYLLVIFLYLLGLLSKPMLVTLPFVLLLLDYWPLERTQLGDARRTGAGKPSGPQPSLTFGRLVLEKIPFLLLATLASGATLAAQSNAIKFVQHFDLSSRLANALISYAAYLGQLVYPANLAAFYPLPTSFPALEVGLSALVLLLVSTWAVLRRKDQPYLLVGWLWYLGMLVPVIGILQVGDQAHADRYTYLPQIGLYILGVWWVADLCRGQSRAQAGLFGVAAASLAALAVIAHAQVTYWHDSVSLWSHTLSCTSNNAKAHYNLACELNSLGRTEEAVQHYEQALDLRPDYVEAHFNLGVALFTQGKLSEAIRHYERGIQLQPDSAEGHYDLGSALAAQGRFNQAIQHLERATQLNPEYADAHVNLGNALVKLGRLGDAVQHYERALQIRPASAEAHYGFGMALAAQGRKDEATRHLQQALELADAQARVEFADHLRAQLRSLQSSSSRIP
jgi:tetratricopeptide (TPR) repeat protein